jgi:hypothetical protein
MPSPFKPDTTSVAVITGEHAFDVPNFHALFRAMNGVDAYIQTLFDFVTDWGDVREKYDVVLFYNMPRPTPGKDENYWGKSVRGAFERLGETGQGIVVLHHALVAYPEWPLWAQIVGVRDRANDWSPDQTVTTLVENPAHPITRELAPFEIVDETYKFPEEPGEGSDVLLTYDSPRSMKAIAWTREHKGARVACYQAGHDATAWANEGFREVLRRAILWTARRI